MSFTPYAKEVKAVVALLEGGDFDSPESLAGAILEEAWKQFQALRGRYTVVGQLRYQGDSRGKDAVEKSLMQHEDRVSPYIRPGDPRMAHVNLGWFPTQKQAETAAQGLAFSPQSGEEWRAIVLPVHHGSAAEWHKQRKELA